MADMSGSGEGGFDMADCQEEVAQATGRRHCLSGSLTRLVEEGIELLRSDKGHGCGE